MADTRQDELERFKTDIPLAHFMADAFGYARDPRKSSANSIFMRGTDGSKVVINRMGDGHWTYWSPDDDRDQGSIIDAVTYRTGENLGLVRKRLRPYLGNGCNWTRTPGAEHLPLTLSPITKDLAAVRQTFEKTLHPLSEGRHRYLNTERGITPAMALPFAGSLYSDPRGNLCLVHRNHDGVTGWETRNFGFRGFMPTGSAKSLWFAGGAGQKEKDQMVVAESGFDAMAYGILHPAPSTWYLSTGGGLSPAQRELLQAAFRKLPQDGSVIVAADNDQAGFAFAETINALTAEANRSDLRFRAHPPDVAKDWNDHLVAIHAEKGSPGPSA